MADHQDIQSLLRFEELQSLLPICEENDIKEYLLRNFPNEYENKERFEALESWLNEIVLFENKARNAVTEKDRLDFEVEKQLFYKKIGLDEDTFKNVIKHSVDFFFRHWRCSNNEERELVNGDIERFLKENKKYKTALDNILGKKENTTTPPV